MIPTEKLYERDGHIVTFQATVVSCAALDDGYAIVLDKTAFFPEGGGQAADTGYIGSARVSDVSVSEGVITHYSDIALDIGAKYECAINWEQRFRRMQNHSGEHVVSGLIHRNFGFDNVGFHMGHKDITLDINGVLSEKEIRMIEIEANKVIYENVSIICEYPSAKELSSIDYRSKLELTENVRLVTIEGYDVCACCAPHVSKTGEIGIIKLLGFEKNKGGTRIHMLCGLDALDDYNMRYSVMSEVARSLSIKQESLAEGISRLEEEISDLKNKNYLLKSELLARKIAEIEETDGNICIFEEGLSQNDMRNLMNSALEKCKGIAAVFCKQSEGEYVFTAASKSVDLRTTASEMRGKLSAKGGGSSEMIQGSVKASEKNIKEFFEV